MSSNQLINDPIEGIIVLFLFFIGSVFTCVAIWKAVKNNDRAWFVVLVIINTFGVMPIIYLFKNNYFTNTNKYYKIAIQGLFVFLLLLVTLIFYTIY